MTTEQRNSVDFNSYTHCLEGPIEVGDYFVWEPLKDHAIAVVRVTRIEGDEIWSYTRYGDARGMTLSNDESRFREACVRIPICPLEEGSC